MSTNGKNLNRNYWKEEDERLLKQWADKAQCYQWLHNKSRDKYQKKNAWYTIPVIIISTITGTANFAQDRIEDENRRQYMIITIGTLSILAGIITTIYQFLKISEINEGHRIATLSWGKFHRNLETELTRHPLDRIGPYELLNMSKDEYNRLIEISPPIDNSILSLFTNKFKHNKELTKPEIGNTINTINVFSMEDNERKKMIDSFYNKANTKKKELIKKEKKSLNEIERFKESFFNLNNRQPTKDEIEKNMKFINNEDNESSGSSNNSNSELSVNETNNKDHNIIMIDERDNDDSSVNSNAENKVETVV